VTVDQLAAAAERANRQAAATLGVTAGFCGLVSRLLGYELASAGERVELAIGSYRGAHHAWLQVGEIVVDPTLDQFDAHAPLATPDAHGYVALVSVALFAQDEDGWRRDERARIAEPGGYAFGAADRDAAADALLAGT
jgi:hypothetical protein